MSAIVGREDDAAIAPGRTDVILKSYHSARVESFIDTIDALGVALADEGHTWSPELRRMYESAIALLTRIQEMRQ